jgi:DNA mismatch repair protein MutS
VNASRFVTAELLEFQSHLSEAEEHLSGREYQIFLEIREEILGSFASIQSLSSKISFLDFTATL